jgi:hypothetical protein
MLSTQGISTVSDTGVSVISRPIENTIQRVTSPDSNFKYNTFGIAYDTDRAYMLWTVTKPTDVQPTQCFRFNTFTNNWTRYPIIKTCGVINQLDNRLYLGPGDENFIERERKDYARTDYADREYELSIPNLAIVDDQVTLSSVVNVEVGDVLVQTQYLTIYQFNQILKMLDSDWGPTDNDYESTLGAVDGTDLRDDVNELAAKLDADVGINNTTFVSSLGGGLTFADIQTDFNIIVNLINTASGAIYSNYPTSVGTIVFEALITQKIQNSNDVLIKFPIPLVEGPVISSRGIKSEVVWSPQTFGDVSLLKQVREGTFIFEDTIFYTATVSYASDLEPSFEEVPFNESGLGDWGAFVWGRQNWGGTGSQVPIRTYIPRNKQKCRFIRPRFVHLASREKFSLFGLSLTLRPVSERAYRE